MKLANPSTLNRYTYVVHDPINSKDPTGNVAIPLGFMEASACYSFGGTIEIDPWAILYDIQSNTGEPVDFYVRYSVLYASASYCYLPERGGSTAAAEAGGEMGAEPQLPPCKTVNGTDIYALNQNIQAGYEHRMAANQVTGVGQAGAYIGMLYWYADQAINAWNYKAMGGTEAFGNFNFGAVGAALGLSDTQILAAAGWGQLYLDTATNRSAAQTAELIAGLVAILFDVGTGKVASWDHSNDVADVQAGIDYYRGRFERGDCQ
jgi:hypothetical protein